MRHSRCAVVYKSTLPHTSRSCSDTLTLVVAMLHASLLTARRGHTTGTESCDGGQQGNSHCRIRAYQHPYTGLWAQPWRCLGILQPPQTPACSPQSPSSRPVSLAKSTQARLVGGRQGVGRRDRGARVGNVFLPYLAYLCNAKPISRNLCACALQRPSRSQSRLILNSATLLTATLGRAGGGAEAQRRYGRKTRHCRVLEGQWPVVSHQSLIAAAQRRSRGVTHQDKQRSAAEVSFLRYTYLRTLAENEYLFPACSLFTWLCASSTLALGLQRNYLYPS
jgi:hypothetical protein